MLLFPFYSPPVISSGGALEYYQKVLMIEPSHMLAYWPLWEGSGPTAEDISGNNRDGTYTGVTLGGPGIGDGHTAPHFDGNLDYVDIFGASLAGAFNGNEGSLMIWFRSDDWLLDGKNALFLYVNTSNRIILSTPTTNNRLNLLRVAGGVNVTNAITGLTDTANYYHFALTWSDSGDLQIAYLNGIQFGASLIGLGTFTGSIASALIGAGLSGAGSIAGYLAHVALWDIPLSPANILTLSQV